MTDRPTDVADAALAGGVPGALPPLAATTIESLRPGPRLIVLGAVHGNETCGTVAQRRVLDDLHAGRLALTAGAVTFVPVANPLAYAHARRTGDRNLNRHLVPKPDPRDYEDHLANWLCPLLAAHDVLLDLHSFQAEGQPFVMVGPPDNAGAIEPFAQAAREEALAARLGVARAVDGWLGTYARGVQARAARGRARAGAGERAGAEAGADTDTDTDTGASVSAGLRDLDWQLGVGTTETMRRAGGCALTLECGQHADPEAPVVAERAIRRTLAFLGLVAPPDGEPPPAPRPLETLHLEDVVDRLDPGDTFARDWRSFDPVAAGTRIGTRAGGEPVVAPYDGWLVFPNAAARPDEEWFYLARRSSRFDAPV